MDKQPLLLIPGLACTSALWADQVRSLADIADIRVADHTRSETMPGIVEQILAAAPERFALAGFSMGGYIAMEMMRTAPERITRLALIGAKHSQDDEAAARRRLTSIRLAENGRYADAISQMMPLLVHPDRQKDETLISAIRTMAHSLGAHAFIRQQKANLGRGLSTDVLKNIQRPTLILCGRQDQLTPPLVHQKMVNLVSNSVMKVIEECGHMAPMEKPDAVTAALRDWLAEPL